MQEYKTINQNLREKSDKEFRANKRYIVITAILTMLALLFVYFTFFVYTNVVVDGGSMKNTLVHGDVLVANKTRSPEKGDIVIIDGVLGEGSWIIKRVIATEGDTVKISDGKVIVNGVVLEEPYAFGETSGGYLFEDGETLTVKENEIFYLGDNRGGSADSRMFGCANIKDIVGVVEEWSIESKEFRNKVYDFFKIDRLS